MEKVVRKYKLGEEPDIIEDYLTLSYTQKLNVLTSIRKRLNYFKKSEHGTGFQRVYRVITKTQG